MKARRLIYYFLPPLLWMSLIFFLSSRPRVLTTHSFIYDFLIYKTLHMIEYGTLYFLWFRALNGSNIQKRHSLMIAFMVSLVYAVSDEVHQTFVPTREGRPRDVLIDAAGMTILYIYIKSRFKTIPKVLL